MDMDMDIQENIKRMRVITAPLFNKMTQYPLPNGKIYTPMSEYEIERQKIIFMKQLQRKLCNQGIK